MITLFRYHFDFFDTFWKKKIKKCQNKAIAAPPIRCERPLLTYGARPESFSFRFVYMARRKTQEIGVGRFFCNFIKWQGFCNIEFTSRFFRQIMVSLRSSFLRRFFALHVPWKKLLIQQNLLGWSFWCLNWTSNNFLLYLCLVEKPCLNLLCNNIFHVEI